MIIDLSVPLESGPGEPLEPDVRHLPHTETGAEMAKRVPDIVAGLQKEKRNCKSLVNLREDEIVDKGIDQLCFSRAIKVRKNKIEIGSRNIIHYYAASVNAK